MTKSATIAVGDPRCVHRGGGTAHVIEEGDLPVLVGHPVALKNDTTFEFSTRVSRGELGVLLHADAEQIAEVYFLAFTSGFCCHIAPLSNERFIPDLLFDIHRCFCSGSLCDFGFADGTGNAS